MSLRRQLDPERLLEHADRLLNGGGLDQRGRPYDVDLRRAVSASYYALFHAVSLATANKVFGSSQAANEHAVRWLNHGDIDGASKQVVAFDQNPTIDPRQSPEKRAVWTLLTHEPPSPRVLNVARQFSALMALRHVADYDSSVRISKPAALQAYGDATAAVRDLGASSDQELSAYLGLIAFAARRLKA